MATEATEGATGAAPSAPAEVATGSDEGNRGLHGRFLAAMHDAGLMKAMDEASLEALGARLGDAPDDVQRLDIVESYYAAEGDAELSGRRIDEDRYFIFREGDRTNAHLVVQELAALLPEVGMVSLERIGSDDGPLVIRAGEHFSAVTDINAHLEADEVDLSALEEGDTVSVQALVTAFNVLLDRHEVTERWLQLPGDGSREAYVATTVLRAVDLCSAGFLEEDNRELLIEFAGW